MTATFSQADDEIKGAFWVFWQANAPAIVGYVPEVRWPNDQERDLPAGEKFWARLSIQTVLSEQTTLAASVEGAGKRRYTSSGLIFVQLFCPKSNVEADELGKLLAETAQNSFRGKSTPGKVTFSHVRINPLPPENLFYRYNIVAEFEYDEIA